MNTTQFANPDGARIAFKRSGSGRNVLFIQGVGVHGDGWLPQTEALSQHYTCLSFDNRGMGQSHSADATLTVEQMVQDALAVMDAVGWDHAHVVGHSLGGLVAQKLALTARSRVTSLALLCTFASGAQAAPLGARMIWLGLRATIGTRAMRTRGFSHLILPPGKRLTMDEVKQFEQLFGHPLCVQPKAAKYQLRAMRRCNVEPELHKLSGLPTIVVSAKHDPIAPPRVGKRIAAAISGAEYHEFATASHGLPITDAKDVNAALKDFWERSEASRERT